jgi:outer membrane protein OmpA-like peptidoglycan-associated protein
LNYRLLAVALALSAALISAGCTDYGVPGADKPWPELSDFPERPDAEATDKRRRRLIGKYGDPEKALPEPTGSPARPPQNSLKVAVIQFARADRELDDRAIDVLNQVAAYAQQSRASVWLFGYASQKVELAAGGSARLASRKLASDRVKAVAVVLIRAGVPADRIELVSRGALDPVYIESAAAGEAGNRRVEIYLAR